MSYRLLFLLIGFVLLAMQHQVYLNPFAHLRDQPRDEALLQAADETPCIACAVLPRGTGGVRTLPPQAGAVYTVLRAARPGTTDAAPFSALRTAPRLIR